MGEEAANRKRAQMRNDQNALGGGREFQQWHEIFYRWTAPMGYTGRAPATPSYLFGQIFVSVTSTSGRPES